MKDTFEDYKKALLDLLGDEESVRLEWNKYVEENMETETMPKIYLNNEESMCNYIFPYMSSENIAKSLFSKEYDATDKYIYEWNGGFRSFNTIFGVINLVNLYQYVADNRLKVIADMLDWAKELKADYDVASETDTLLVFADSSANFLDRFIEVASGLQK